jgi:hypothetical protein
LGLNLDILGDLSLAEAIIEGNAECEKFSVEALKAIVKQLSQHPVIQKIIKHVITVEDFKSAFNYVPEKNTASLYLG